MQGIYKEIFLTRKGLLTVIEYVQGTNGIPINLKCMDYIIPDGAEARIYVKKPSGAEVYNPASISGNMVVIDPTTQMFAEEGRAMAQVQILTGAKVAATFLLAFDVEKNIISESAVESTNEYTILEGLITEARAAISDTEAATELAARKAQAAQTAANSANTAADNANAKASACETATQKALTAASSAAGAAQEADASKQACDTATEAAQDATQEALEAAETAKEYVLGDISNKTVTFAEQDGDLISGDDLATLMGKTKKKLDGLNTDLTTNIQNGYVYANYPVSPGTITDIPVTFPKAFKSTPRVVAGMLSATTSATYGNLNCFVSDVTTEGFTLRVANGNTSGGALRPGFCWIAMI